jgi:hypothetical protein
VEDWRGKVYLGPSQQLESTAIHRGLRLVPGRGLFEVSSLSTHWLMTSIAEIRSSKACMRRSFGFFNELYNSNCTICFLLLLT